MSPLDVLGARTAVGALNTNAPGYDLVLLAHVAAAVVGLVAVVLAGISALALRGALAQGGQIPESLVRYYRPGINWAGRVLFLVPVLGVALLAMDGGQWSFADAWVSAGMAVWAVIAGAAEMVLWPSERQLQAVVASRVAHVAGGSAGSDGQREGQRNGRGEGLGDRDGSEPAGLDGLCVRTGMLGLVLGVALVATAVLMVAKP